MKMIKRAKCGRCRKSYSRDDGYHEQASIQACLRSRNSILCLRNKLIFLIKFNWLRCVQIWNKDSNQDKLPEDISKMPNCYLLPNGG